MSAHTDGVTYTALTEKKKNCGIFNDFYTNRKASTPSSQNTQLSAQAHGEDASMVAKVDNSSDTSKENDEEVKQSLSEEKEERILHAILREKTLED